MSNISEAIKRQAQAVKANQETIKQAEALEAAAKLLRAQATKPAPMAFAKARAKDRAANLEKFAAARKANTDNQVNAALNTAGWSFMSNGANGEKTFGMKGKPGLQMKVSGDFFSVKYGEHVIQPKVKIVDIAAFLVDLKKKI